MEGTLVHRILRAYEVDYTYTRPAQKGYRNTSTPVVLEDNTMLNLILYKREPGILSKIKEANRIGDLLAMRGLPARKTYSKKILLITSRDGQQRYGALYDYLPGGTIPWEAYTRAHIRLVGKTMGKIHELLKDEITTIDCIDQYQAVLARMHRYFTNEDVQNAMREKLHCNLSATSLKRCEQTLRVSRQLPPQVLHMDFVRGNILFNEQANKPNISGVIDFEKVANGPRIFDIARTLAFLVVDCKYKNEEDVRHAFLCSGYLRYTSYVTVRDRSFNLLEELINLFLIYDFYKFLRHNPYESLDQNEHFVRTRSFLQKRQHLVDGKEG